MPKPFDFSPLASCADILVLEMVRHDERSSRWRTPWHNLDQRARDASRDLVNEGLRPLHNSGRHRVFRLAPSRRLEPMMLDFRKGGLAGLIAHGGDDARSFLASPQSCRAH